ncbi:coiled-coil domain-containing protein 180 isoform X2 [Cheilinus undulatus]|uniref:coiled-coil domain-containing protein 180 isoform X2 n=1 Tax=Cheilinus undulatus TaxID=241271 RepID=UPI001BD5F92E|nr:coiled-coil domain-containing protein 180 isoform X2 [Cheilinus undulatus]
MGGRDRWLSPHQESPKLLLSQEAGCQVKTHGEIIVRVRISSSNMLINVSMAGSRAVPSGKVNRQLFDAQVQLSRSLLGRRRDTRTECLSAEDSNTHCSATSRLLCPLSKRGQQVDDADEVYEVLQLPDSVVVNCPSSDIIERLKGKKSKRHEEALKQLDTEFTDITQVYETQVKTVSDELLCSLKDVAWSLDIFKDRMANLEHLEDVSLQDINNLWEELEENVKTKKIRIKELDQKLTETENKRTDQARVVLGKYCPLLERINFLPPSDVHRLIHNKATMLNQSLLANRRCVARLLLNLQQENLQQASLLRYQWENCLSRWRDNRVREVISHYSLFCSHTDQRLVTNQQVVQKMKQTQQDLIERRCDIVNKICSLVPPSCSISLVSDWFNLLTDINQHIDSFHDDFLHELRFYYEQTWQNRQAEVKRCKEELSALQLTEEEVNDSVISQLLPLIGQSQSLDEEQLANFDKSCKSLADRARNLSRSVFSVMRGAALLWETHSFRLKNKEEELQQQLDTLRESQQQQIQRKKAHLDILLSRFCQEASEDSLKTSLDKAVLYLQEVQKSYRELVADQCQLLDHLPSLLLEELFCYSSSLSSFFHLNHTYRPSPEELQELHSSFTTFVDQENCEGPKIQKLEEMKMNHPITFQTGTDSAQSSKSSWLPEAENALDLLCDHSNDVKFTSSKGVAYSGPAFTSSALYLPDHLLQETHLTLFPVELLTQKLNRIRSLFLDSLEQHFHDVLNSAITVVKHRKEVLHCELELQLQQLSHQHIHTHIYQPRLDELQLHKQCVDAHCEEVADILASCRMDLQELQTSIDRKSQEFIATVSNMEDKVLTADNSQRLEAVISALQDCRDQHIKDNQHCQTTFRQSFQLKLMEVRHKTTQLLNSLRLFSEGGNFAPREVKLFQRRLKVETKNIKVAEEAIYSELDVFGSKSLQQVKEVSGRFEETLSLLKSEVMFMEKIKKFISSTQVNIKAEAASSNQQQAAISSRLKDLRRMVEDTQATPDHVCSLLSSITEKLRKRCQYLDFSPDNTLHESLSARPKSRKQVCSDPPPGFLQPSRKDVDFLHDPAIGIIKSLNRFSMTQDDAAKAAEREEGGRAVSAVEASPCRHSEKEYSQSSLQRHQRRFTGSVSNLSAGRGCRPVSSDRRFQVFGPKPDPEQTTHSLSSAVNSVLWKANDVILLVAEDFYQSKRASSCLLVPDSLDKWAESMQQRLLGYQEQARKLLSTSRQELMNQFSVLEELLYLLPKVLISNHEQQHEAQLRNEVDGVKMKLDETLETSEKEKHDIVNQLRVSLRDDELQTLNSREKLRQQHLHDTICLAHQELQKCVRVRAEKFVTSLASLTEKLLHLLDSLFMSAGTEAAPLPQNSGESTVTMETGAETGQKLCTVSRTFPGIPYLMPSADTKADPPSSAAIATTAPITTTRCTSFHVAVIEQRESAVKRFEQLLKSESSHSDDDKERRLRMLQRWSTHWGQQIRSLTNTY